MHSIAAFLVFTSISMPSMVVQGFSLIPPPSCNTCTLSKSLEGAYAVGSFYFHSQCHAECEGYPAAAIIKESDKKDKFCPQMYCVTKKDICVNGVFQFQDECDARCDGPANGKVVEGKCPNNCGCTNKGYPVCAFKSEWTLETRFEGKTFPNHCSAACAGFKSGRIFPNACEHLQNKTTEAPKQTPTPIKPVETKPTTTYGLISETHIGPNYGAGAPSGSDHGETSSTSLPADTAIDSGKTSSTSLPADKATESGKTSSTSLPADQMGKGYAITSTSTADRSAAISSMLGVVALSVLVFSF